MHVDHLIFAVGPDGLQTEAARLAELLGADDKDGGFHPRFGTRNHVIPLADSRYVEVVEVLDHPAAEKAPFGQIVRARSEMGGGWLGWVLSVDDIAPFEKRLDRQAVPGSRYFPDGRLLEWEQIGVKGVQADPQLPYFVQWLSDESVRPSALRGEVKLSSIEISGSVDRVEEWIGCEIGEGVDGINFTFVAPNGLPGISTVSFTTADGRTVTV